MKQRFLPLALAAAMLLGVFSTTAGAAIAVEAQEPFRYYDQLDRNQKKLYDALAQMDGAGEITVRLPEPIVYTADESGDSKKAYKLYTDIGQGALDALLYDDPSMLWIDKTGCTSSAGAKGTAGDGEAYTWTVSQLTMNVAAIKSAAKRTQEMEAALFAPKGATRYEKVKYLHDQLCKRVEYVEDAPNAHNPYGALVEGKAVCEGYAKAFKILCDRADIPCVIVSGTGYTTQTGEDGINHMWNYVQMEDGKWYALDATWNDQPGKICRDFFLVGANTLSTKLFGSTMFSESHVPDGDFSRKGIVFEFPKLNPKMYRLS